VSYVSSGIWCGQLVSKTVNFQRFLDARLFVSGDFTDVSNTLRIQVFVPIFILKCSRKLSPWCADTMDNMFEVVIFASVRVSYLVLFA